MLSGSFSIVSATGVTSNYGFSGQTLAEIAQSFNQPPDEQNDNTGITATLNGPGTMITFTVTAGGTPSISGVGIKDVTPSSTDNQEVNTGTILNTLTVANSIDTLSGFMNIVEGVDTSETPTTLNCLWCN
jgi:hypothetical protein